MNPRRTTAEQRRPKVLEMLRAGHRPNDISRVLGLSVVAIWHDAQSMKDAGEAVEALPALADDGNWGPPDGANLSKHLTCGGTGWFKTALRHGRPCRGCGSSGWRRIPGPVDPAAWAEFVDGRDEWMPRLAEALAGGRR